MKKQLTKQRGVYMAWNEPGGSGNKDPWGNRNNEQGPPDLDEIIKNFQKKLSGIFGGKGGGSGGSGGDGKGGSTLIGLALVVILFLWAASGIYVVDSAQRGVVLRFGQFMETTIPGLHWHIPFPVESVQIVDVDRINKLEIGFREGVGGREATPVPQESLMLTQDENIVDIQFAVQYRIKDAKDYLFNVKDPDITLRQATESAVREAIGKSKMDFVLTQGQAEIGSRTKDIMQGILDNYQTGLEVTSMNLQKAQPPREVKDAFDDAIKAREDQQRSINNAHAYANDILPKARGNAARQLEEANGYKARVVAQAEGEASRFTQLLKEYKKSPRVTRERLYVETIETVMSNTSKILLDTEGGNNLVYLPLDRLMSQTAQRPDETKIPANFNTDDVNRRVEEERRRARDNLRSRGGR